MYAVSFQLFISSYYYFYIKDAIVAVSFNPSSLPQFLGRKAAWL